jgi:thiol-disulfide isomerase/thioredoxin
MPSTFRSLVIAFSAALVLASCQNSPPQQGLWTGSVSIGEGRSLPFRMELDFRSDPPSGAFLVGAERTPIPEILVYGDSLILSISEYKAAMRGVWDGARLTGTYERYRSDTTGIAFTAAPDGPQEKTPPGAATGIRLSGKFRVFAPDRNGVDSSSSATFWIKGDSVFGTIIDPSGDYGLMAGTQHGTTVVLNRFTGWQVNQLELHSRGTEWEALYYVRTLDPIPLVLKPLADDAPLTLAHRATTMKDPKAPFTFWGITPQGDTLRNTDARFTGKVLLVDIMGTWCHNCLDAAPVLEELYERYGDRGLEVVGLAFEISDDPMLARKNLSLYQKRHGISFPLLFCGSLDAANVQQRIRSQLEGFGAYPTTLFVGRDGRVRSIHMGFTGPGTGELYQSQITAYFREVERLIADRN